MSVLNKRINGYLAPLVETNERYIMQGQVYGKDDMKFEFMNFLPVNTTCGHMPSLIRRCTSILDVATNYDWHAKRSRGNMYIVDNNDPTISYCIIDSNVESDNSSKNRIVKFQTKNGVTEKVWDANFQCPQLDYYVNYVSYTAVEILGQSNNYIIICFARSSVNTGYNAARFNQHIVKRFDKVTGAYSDVFDYDDDGHIINSGMHGTSLKKIYETETGIYFYVFNGHNNAIAIGGANPGESLVYRYDKVNNTTAQIGKIGASATKTGNTLFSSQGFKNGDNIYFYAYSNVTNPEMRLIKINVITNTVSSTNVLSVFNEKIALLPKSNTADLGFHCRLAVELFIKEYEGKKYLNIIGYSTMGAASDGYFNRITTFLIDENSGYDLIAQDYCDPFNNTAIRGFVEMIDENLLLVTNRNATKVLRFDTIQGKYIEIQTIDLPTYSIGCDSKNNIWITDTSTNLHKFTVELPVDVQLKFENEDIDYKGIDINNKIIVQAFNYKNERVAIKLELTIKGPMTFEDNTKVVRITTSKDEPIKVPVVIKGSGIISVYPKIML